MTIGGWILFGIIALCIIGVGAFASYEWFYISGEKHKLRKIIIPIGISIALCFAVYAGMNLYYKSTESGKRAIKSQESNFNAGIERLVTIYDVNGKVIKQYEGRFDVEYDDNRILFDDENGKRHVVYYTTGTVAIDEK